jgi:RNA polymerase sigma-70 factor (ECF subfamily)
VRLRTIDADERAAEIDEGRDDPYGRPSAAVPPQGLNQALAAAQAGDEAGFVLLYRHLQPRLLRYAIALVGQDAEDVTAEAWLHITRDLRSFRGDLDAFRGWAAAIVRHRAVDAARSRIGRPVIPTEYDALCEHAATDDTADHALDQISTEKAISMIAALPQSEAEAVLLRAVIGLDAVAAGRVLDKKPGAVRVAAHRGLRKLAAQLDAVSAPVRKAGFDE